MLPRDEDADEILSPGTRAVIEQACGFAPSEAPLLGYLEQKFADLYDL